MGHFFIPVVSVFFYDLIIILSQHPQSHPSKFNLQTPPSPMSSEHTSCHVPDKPQQFW